MDFVTPIITPIVQSLMEPVKKHLGFFCSSTKYVKNMDDRLKELNETKHGMEVKMKEWDDRNLVIPDLVPRWMAKAETIEKEVGMIPTGANGCFNMKLRYKAGKGSLNIIKKIDDLLESKIEWIKEQRPLAMVTSPSSSEPYDGARNIFPSRHSMFSDVLKSLELDSKTQMTVLWGMGGMGKTTMMEEIHKLVKNKGMFQWVFRVVIGKTYDPITLQIAIAQQMQETLSEMSRDANAQRLGERFEKMSKDGTKILVILDDLWEAINLKDIGLASPFPRGFKLLVTSRNQKVDIKMDTETRLFKIEGLEEADANSFFWKTVNCSNVDDDLREIGESILKKCRGLPLAIETIALALNGQEKEAWELAQKSLQRHNLNEVDLEAVVQRIFEISYNYLKKDLDKAIFVLCGLFPDDFDIALEELLRYGWGLQLFDEAYSLGEARKRTNTSVSNLIRANLLVESQIIGCVKMHDLAREFVLSNISKFKQASIVNHCDKSEWPTKDAHECCERILLTCKGMFELPQDFYYPNLALLKLMNGDKGLKFPKDFHKRMEKLQVIAYYNIKSPLILVPLQCSSGLRTLCLCKCSLVDNDISFLGDLVNLEVLSVAHCNIQRLPSTIRKLKKLKLLGLTDCYNLCIDDGVFQDLEKLEEIYMRGSPSQAIKLTEASCNELEMRSRNLSALEVEFFENILQPENVSYKKLQRFRISMGCLLEVDTEDIYSFKNTLKLVTNRSDLRECKINELFSKTEELHLSVKDMTNVEDISMSPSQHSTFCKLKVLHIFKCADLTHVFTIPVANGLKQLESLTVTSCPVLKSLVTLCDHVNILDLPKLVELNLYDLPEFTSIILDDDISATQPLLNKQVVVPNLSKLTVGSLDKLKQIWACDITSDEEDNVNMLREIEVNDCNSVVNLFPRNPMKLLRRLEELKVTRCSSIEALFYINLNEQLSSDTSSLRRIEVEELEELKEVWKINDENNCDYLICDFQGVKSIQIQRCKKFRNVFTPTTANFNMGALVKLSIQRCGEENVELVNNSEREEITSISEVNENMHIVAFSSCTFHRFPSLEDLRLTEMETLIHVWKYNNWNEFFIPHKHQPQSSFQNLTTIKLSKCKSIKYLFSPLMSKILCGLKKVKIEWCEGMEKVVSNRDHDDDDDDDEVLATSTHAITLFPHLDSLKLYELNTMKHIGGCVVKGKSNHDQLKLSQEGNVFSWSLCQFSREIDIRNCDALSSLVPSYAAGHMQKLQYLTISYCGSMVEVFETKKISDSNISDCSSKVDQGSYAALPIPTTKNITAHKLSSLKSLDISRCPQLEYMFTFSTLESLTKLENLEIRFCDAMKVIVREENGEASSSKVVVGFPRLESIKLLNLPNLAGFFVGMNIEFEWPSLDYVNINNCPQMRVFTSGESRAPKLKGIHTWPGRYNLQCGLNFHQISPPTSESSSFCPAAAEGTPWSFHNLIEINLKSNYTLKNIIPSYELLQLQNLEMIRAYGSSTVEEVFEVTNSESQTVVKFPKLRVVELGDLKRLKYIWKSNQWRILEFPNLTILSIFGCNSLEHVFTASMVGTLMQLQELAIEDCSHMEVIVKKEESDAKSEIILPCLKSLQLEYLSSLKGFCLGKENFRLPSLTTLVIKKCPEIRIFSEGRAIAPELKLVETSLGWFHAGKDINSFIVTKKQEENIFGFGRTAVIDVESSSEDE